MPLPEPTWCFSHPTQKATTSTPKPRCSDTASSLKHVISSEQDMLPSHQPPILPPHQSRNPTYKSLSFSKIKLKCLFSAALIGDKIPLVCILSQQTNSVSSFRAFKAHFSHIYYGTYHTILKSSFVRHPE